MFGLSWKMLADIPAGPRILPEEIAKSSMGVVIAAVAVGLGMILLGIWLFRRGQTPKE